ncbi:hypothetical protein MKW98_021786, partial [Papaver atlanticum]
LSKARRGVAAVSLTRYKNQDSHFQVSKAEQNHLNVPLCHLLILGKKAMLSKKRKGKGAMMKMGMQRLNRRIMICVGLKPKEERPTAIPSKESDVKPKKKNRRNRGEDFIGLFKASKSSSVPCTGNMLENDATPKKKHRRNRGEDGDAKIKNMEQHDPTDDD